MRHCTVPLELTFGIRFATEIFIIYNYHRYHIHVYIGMYVCMYVCTYGKFILRHHDPLNYRTDLYEADIWESS
jgi:hypothetical protein